VYKAQSDEVFNNFHIALLHQKLNFNRTFGKTEKYLGAYTGFWDNPFCCSVLCLSLSYFLFLITKHFRLQLMPKIPSKTIKFAGAQIPPCQKLRRPVIFRCRQRAVSF